MQKQGSPSLLRIAFRKDQSELRMERFPLFLLAQAKSVSMLCCKASPASSPRSSWKPKGKERNSELVNEELVLRSSGMF